MASRRSFLKLGLVGGALLGAAGAASWFVGRDPVDDRREVLAAAIGAMLDGALPAQPPARETAIATTLSEVEIAIAGLPPATQAELAQLFALAAAAPSRFVLTGLTNSWSDASPAEVADVLQRWRTHRLALLQSAYHGLHDLILGTWYAAETHWEAIGYPGPPRL